MPARRMAEAPGAVSSVLLHLGFAGLLLLAAGLRPPAVPPEESLAVEIVTPEQFAAARRRPEPVPQPVPEASSSSAPAARPAAPEPSPVMRPKIMLSGRTLADPRSRQARAALRQMTGDERMVQLCDLEAMAQIAAWSAAYRPDRVVDHATRVTRVAGYVVVAEGAAFRSDHAWYGLRFRCALTADLAVVAAFEFSVGEAVPREDWEELGLPPVH
jgi:hypothetical protein